MQETDRIQASTLFSISESNDLIFTILGQAQSGIPTFAESKFTHATELSNHARTGPSPLAARRPPRAFPSVFLKGFLEVATASFPIAFPRRFSGKYF